MVNDQILLRTPNDRVLWKAVVIDFMTIKKKQKTAASSKSVHLKAFDLWSSTQSSNSTCHCKDRGQIILLGLTYIPVHRISKGSSEENISPLFG